MFCINIVQPSLELEANNLNFCFEDLLKKRAAVDSRDCIPQAGFELFFKSQSL